MPEIDLVEKSYINISNLGLSIQVHLNGFSFCIIDITGNTIYGIKYFSFENLLTTDDLVNALEKLFHSEQLLNIPYNKVFVSYLTQKSTLIPSSFFDEHNLKAYFEFNHTLNELDEIHYNYLNTINAFNVFTIPNYVANTFIKKFSNVEFIHQATPFIIHITRQKKESEDSEVFLNLNHRFFDIVVIKNGQFSLYNTFNYQNSNDLIYFILYVYKQLELNTGTDPVILSGEQCRSYSFVNEIKRYIRKVRFNLVPPGIKLSHKLKKLDSHLFLNNINMHHCG